jgi:indole-3-glycerol phosphate synthase
LMGESFLERIVAHKRRELVERRTVTSETELERLAARAPVPRMSGDAGALFPVERLGVIAEVKRASPSKGAIALELDAVDQARGYAAGEADAISVLTDREFYRGSLDDLRAIRAAVPMPVMRKDFILDRYGLLEARAAGADLVLLIVAALGRDNLARLMRATAELGMVPLVEAYTRAEAEIALETGAELIGVNNRDLHTFEVSLETTERLAPLLAPHATVVSLSGIWSIDDARRVVDAGARAVLVGEALVRAADPAAFIRELRSVSLTPQPPRPCAGEGEPATARGEGELTGASGVSPLPHTEESVELSERSGERPIRMGRG